MIIYWKCLWFICLTNIAFAIKPTIITAYDVIDSASMEIKGDGRMKTDSQHLTHGFGLSEHLTKFSGIDPDIAEDAILTTVIFI